MISHDHDEKRRNTNSEDSRNIVYIFLYHQWVIDIAWWVQKHRCKYAIKEDEVPSVNFWPYEPLMKLVQGCLTRIHRALVLPLNYNTP